MYDEYGVSNLYNKYKYSSKGDIKRYSSIE